MQKKVKIKMIFNKNYSFYKLILGTRVCFLTLELSKNSVEMKLLIDKNKT